MNRVIQAVLLFAVAFQALAANLVTDPAPASTSATHCGFYIDGGARQDVAVISDASGKWCKKDISALAPGAHSAQVSFVLVDAVWGNSEGPKSTAYPLRDRPGQRPHRLDSQCHRDLRSRWRVSLG